MLREVSLQVESGEAIAIGQVAAARLSATLLGLPAGDCRRIRDLLARAGLPVQVRLRAGQKQKLWAAMRLDKKVSGGDVKFVLARKIGQVVWGRKVATDLLEQSLNPQLPNPPLSHACRQ